MQLMITKDCCFIFMQGAIGKAKDCAKLQDEGRMTESEVASVLTRADTISYGTLAEMNNFQHERVHDFKCMMQKYLQAQIAFYKRVCGVCIWHLYVVLVCGLCVLMGM